MVPSILTHVFSWSSVSFFVVIFLSLLQWHSVRGVWHMKQSCLGAIFSFVVFFAAELVIKHSFICCFSKLEHRAH